MVDFYSQRQIIEKMQYEVKTLRDAMNIEGAEARLAELTEITSSLCV